MSEMREAFKPGDVVTIGLDTRGTIRFDAAVREETAS